MVYNDMIDSVIKVCEYFHLTAKDVLFAILIAVFVIYFALQFYEKYKPVITDKMENWRKKRNKEEEMLKVIFSNNENVVKLQEQFVSLNEELKDLKIKQEENVQASIKHDEKLEDAISGLAVLLDEMNHKQVTDDERFASMFTALRESLGDRIEQKSRYYLEINEIPIDELDGYISLHDAYKGIGGNHFRDVLFKKVIKKFTDLDVGEDGRIID